MSCFRNYYPLSKRSWSCCSGRPGLKNFQGCHSFFFVLLFLSTVCLPVITGAAQPDRKTVLILHSYHKADWSDSLLTGIDSVLGRMPAVDLVVEYMDTKRIKSDAYYTSLDEIYRLKYDNIRFDAILACDDNAYRFALARQNGLFKQAPTVFCGVNRFDPLEIEGSPLVTGVVEKDDFDETLRFATQARPGATTVNVILDYTGTGQSNKSTFLEVLRRHYPQLTARFLINISLTDLADRLAALPADDFVFFISFWQDGSGNPVSPDQLAPILYGSSVPIFGRSEWMLNKGLTGGKCVSGFHQGQAAAQLVKRILSGENAASIPVNLNSPNHFMFDYLLLKRYGIEPSTLPPGSTLFNKPEPTLSERYRHLIWSVTAVLVLLCALVFFLALNVATRHRTEKALRASEKRFRTLVENAADAIFLSDDRGSIVDANRKAWESLGYTHAELLARHVEDVDVNFKPEQTLEWLRTKLQTADLVSIESAQRRKDGSAFPVQLRISLLEIEKEPFFLGLAQDITERKAMEAELRESEARYRQLVQHAPAGIFELDLQRLRFLNVNGVMCEYTGYMEDEFLALDPLTLMVEDSASAFSRRMESLKSATPTPPPIEYRIKGKNGRVFWVLVNASFTFDEDNRPLKATCVVHDLTALREAQAEKKRLEDKLIQIQKIEALGTLAGGIAHDFNNLLMGIQGNASLMLLDDDRRIDDTERLRSIENYVQRGVDLTSQLLGMARGGKYEIRPTDINALIHDSAAIFSRTRKEVRFHQNLHKSLSTVACDRGQIDQVLLNIFINAWQAMPAGGELTITTENTILKDAFVQPHSLPAGRYVKISIADTGSGMDPDTMSKIFDPFFTTKEVGHGTGLGLASAYGIVKNHDGIIDVSSHPGQGSTFNIYLPAVDMDATAESAADVRLVSGNGKILLIDDETMILDIGCEMLEKLGYEVLTAASGAAALEIFRANRADVDMVVMDMIMPDLGGVELFAKLQEIRPDIRVLLSSGYSINEQAAKILARGCRGFIQKPFSLHEFSQKVRKIMDE